MISKTKDSLLRNTASPRIIFVGGSNLSFGLNSQMIKDSLHLNPVNTAIHASLGLKFMMDNTLQYVRNGDIIILVPEYEHFYRNYNFTSEELFHLIFDADKSKIKLMNIPQLLSLASFAPKYSLSKFDIEEHKYVLEQGVYSSRAYNKFGDISSLYRGNKKEPFAPYEMSASENDFNNEVIKQIKIFQSLLYQKKASLYLSYPCLQDTTYHNLKNQIAKVQKELNESGLTILGTPERYMMPDSLMFNTPYHLNNIGAKYRTTLFIADFKKVYLKNQNAK
ncbi:MAG: hypothetical protein ABJB05_13740 [Parafilimonas sp.]